MPPRQNQDDVEKTIDTSDEVDEASYESMPASDPPAFTATYTQEVDVEAEEEREEE